MRNKPAIAFTSQLNAENNIRVKLRELKRLYEDPVASSQFALPKSVRQFNKWNSSGSTAVVVDSYFYSSSNETLQKYPMLLANVKLLLASIKAQKTKPKLSKEDKISRLRDDRTVHQTIRKIAEAELANERRRTIQLESENRVLRARLKSIETASEQRITDCENEIASLRNENSRLISSLRKVAPIGRAG